MKNPAFRNFLISRFLIKILGISIEIEIFEILSISKYVTIVFHVYISKILQNIPFEIYLSLVPCHTVSKLQKKHSEKQKDKKLLQKEIHKSFNR